MRTFGLLLIALNLILPGARTARAAADRSTRVTPVVRAVQAALPAVVNLSTSKEIQVHQRGLPLFRTPLDDLFPPLGFGQTIKQTSLGSGVLVDNQGHVLTNYHVAAFGKTGTGQGVEISAMIYGENEPRRAFLVGGDPAEDIAILKLQGEPPQVYLPFGRSDDLMVGETVIAVGNALGNASTVTQGIISYIGREISDEQGNALSGLVQTDADINPGNSGGPLININGELIGINTAISTTSGGSVGLGFAIPVNRARQVYDYIVHRRLSLAARLNIRVSNLEGDLKRYFYQVYPDLVGDPQLPGVIVRNVGEGPLKDKINEMSVITELQGRRIRTVDDFALLESEMNVNRIRLRYCYRGEFGNLDVPLQAANSTVKDFEWQGLSIQELDDYWRHRLGLTEDSYGLVVTSVQSSRRGLIQVGDIITGLSPAERGRRDRYEVDNLAEFQRVIDHLAARDAIRIYYLRIVDGRAKRFSIDFVQKKT